jgi:NAD(P)-dependent dehydrogenase (short-subunit alcohol dehydrogenase family)
VCLISGAASGIGRASALRIASEGGIPVIADLPLQEAAGKKVVEEANAELPKGTKEKAMFLTLDVTKEDQWAAAIKVSERGDGGTKRLSLTRIVPT